MIIVSALKDEHWNVEIWTQGRKVRFHNGHILREIIAQDLGGVIVATLRDERTLAKLMRAGAKPGDPFDGEVGGFVLTPASGKPVRIRGTVVYVGSQTALPRHKEPVAAIEFGRGNLLVLTSELVQVVDPEQLRFGPVDPRRYTGWVLKSRAHFRRGFDDTGYARKILIVDAPGPYLGTVHLDALPYKHVELGKFFPFNAGGLDAARKQAAQ